MYCTEAVLQSEIVSARSHRGISESKVGGRFGVEQDSANIIWQELVVDDLERREGVDEMGWSK